RSESIRPRARRDREGRSSTPAQRVLYRCSSVLTLHRLVTGDDDGLRLKTHALDAVGLRFGIEVGHRVVHEVLVVTIREVLAEVSSARFLPVDGRDRDDLGEFEQEAQLNGLEQIEVVALAAVLDAHVVVAFAQLAISSRASRRVSSVRNTCTLASMSSCRSLRMAPMRSVPSEVRIFSSISTESVSGFYGSSTSSAIGEYSISELQYHRAPA